METGTRRFTLKSTLPQVYSVAFSHADPTRLASGTTSSTIDIWDVTRGQCLLKCRGHSAPVWTVAFSPSQSSDLASGSIDTTVKLWDIVSGKAKVTLTEHSHKVASLDNEGRGDSLL